MIANDAAYAASSLRSRIFTYASFACSSQYGFPGSDVSSQNRKVFVPGSPIGQQQAGAERRGWAGDITGRGTTGATCTGTAGRGLSTGAGRSA